MWSSKIIDNMKKSGLKIFVRKRLLESLGIFRWHFFFLYTKLVDKLIGKQKKVIHFFFFLVPYYGPLNFKPPPIKIWNDTAGITTTLVVWDHYVPMYRLRYPNTCITFKWLFQENCLLKRYLRFWKPYRRLETPNRWTSLEWGTSRRQIGLIIIIDVLHFYAIWFLSFLCVRSFIVCLPSPYRHFSMNFHFVWIIKATPEALNCSWHLIGHTGRRRDKSVYFNNFMLKLSDLADCWIGFLEIFFLCRFVWWLMPT